MRDFKLLVEDRRYSVPSLFLVQARDPIRAEAIAHRLLEQSAEYLAVEVWAEGQLLFIVRPARASPSNLG